MVLNRLGGGSLAPSPLPGETVTDRWAANRLERHHAVGGIFFATNRRLVFLPHRLERMIGSKPWAVATTDVTFVDEEGRGGGPWIGGMRRRLKIQLLGGASDVFIVNRLETRMAKLEQLLGTGGQERSTH